jgi:hypothetical protein
MFIVYIAKFFSRKIKLKKKYFNCLHYINTFDSLNIVFFILFQKTILELIEFFCVNFYLYEGTQKIRKNMSKNKDNVAKLKFK